MPRLIRRQPLSARLAAALNPVDLFFRLCEELDSLDWDAFSAEWGLSIGAIVNVVYMVARANSFSEPTEQIDVFLDGGASGRSTTWTSWLAFFVAIALAGASVFNTAYMFASKRRYRMFETPLSQNLATPSAQRVPADSSPISTPFRSFVDAVRTPLEKRVQPNNSRSGRSKSSVPEVWELAVWNPPALALRLFCSFSPGHVLVYALLLPASVADVHPSLTAFKAVVFGIILTIQLTFLHANYAQQSRDLAILHRAVANEYDIKYVHPLLRRSRRDVGVQANLGSSRHRPSQDVGQPAAQPVSEVDMYTSTASRNRYQIRPNANYASLLDQANSSATAASPFFSRLDSAFDMNIYSGRRGVGGSALATPVQPHNQPTKPIHAPLSTGRKMGSTGLAYGGLASAGASPFRPTATTTTPRRTDAGTGTNPGSTGDGGSLGVYTHAASPIRRARLSTSGTSRLRKG